MFFLSRKKARRAGQGRATQGRAGQQGGQGGQVGPEGPEHGPKNCTTLLDWPGEVGGLYLEFRVRVKGLGFKPEVAKSTNPQRALLVSSK